VLGQPAEVYSSETIRIEITAECLLCGRGEAGFMPCSPNLACLQIKFSTRSYNAQRTQTSSKSVKTQHR
jgi:hypothetical protein